MIHFITQTEL